MLALQEFLHATPDFDLLWEKYGVKAKPHSKYPNLVLFKYDQVRAHADKLFGEPIVRESRGIILDQDAGWKVVSRAFDKFFNYGEEYAAEIDWPSAVVQEKLDGSLCVLYYYDGAWQVSTSGSPDASGNINDTGVTFSDYFWRTWGRQELSLPWSRGVSYIFELTGPLNRVVVKHSESKITLLGARDALTGDQLTARDAEWIWGSAALVRPPCVQEYSLGSVTEIAATFTALSPLEHEGYVVVDGSFNRVKVKHPKYVELHHMRDSTTTRRFVEVVRKGEVAEVLLAFPEFKDEFVEIENKFLGLIGEITNDYREIYSIEPQKEFAFAALKKRCPAALFHVRKECNYTDFAFGRNGRNAYNPTELNHELRQFFLKMPLDNLMKLLGVSVREKH